MSVFLTRVDLTDDNPAVLKLTITEEIESLGHTREVYAQETIYGLTQDSVIDKTSYLRTMISLMVRVVETEEHFTVDGAELADSELDNLLTRYNNREENS